jgi:hypothetical protein
MVPLELVIEEGREVAVLEKDELERELNLKPELELDLELKATNR